MVSKLDARNGANSNGGNFINWMREQHDTRTKVYQTIDSGRLSDLVFNLRSPDNWVTHNPNTNQANHTNAANEINLRDMLEDLRQGHDNRSIESAQLAEVFMKLAELKLLRQRQRHNYTADYGTALNNQVTRDETIVVAHKFHNLLYNKIRLDSGDKTYQPTEQERTEVITAGKFLQELFALAKGCSLDGNCLQRTARFIGNVVKEPLDANSTNLNDRTMYDLLCTDPLTAELTGRCKPLDLTLRNQVDAKYWNKENHKVYKALKP